MFGSVPAQTMDEYAKVTPPAGGANEKASADGNPSDLQIKSAYKKTREIETDVLSCLIRFYNF
jgi:hypothetical protein